MQVKLNDSPGRRGQSDCREQRHHDVTKVAEIASEVFFSDNKIKMLVLLSLERQVSRICSQRGI